MIKMGGTICDNCRTLIPKDKIVLVKTKKGVQHCCPKIECLQQMEANTNAGKRAQRNKKW